MTGKVRSFRIGVMIVVSNKDGSSSVVFVNCTRSLVQRLDKVCDSTVTGTNSASKSWYRLSGNRKHYLQRAVKQTHALRHYIAFYAYREVPRFLSVMRHKRLYGNPQSSIGPHITTRFEQYSTIQYVFSVYIVTATSIAVP